MLRLIFTYLFLWSTQNKLCNISIYIYVHAYQSLAITPWTYIFYILYWPNSKKKDTTKIKLVKEFGNSCVFLLLLTAYICTIDSGMIWNEMEAQGWTFQSTESSLKLLLLNSTKSYLRRTPSPTYKVHAYI